MVKDTRKYTNNPIQNTSSIILLKVKINTHFKWVSIKSILLTKFNLVYLKTYVCT